MSPVSPFVLGAVLGAAALPAAYVAAPMPRGTGVPGLDLRVVHVPSGEVALDASKPLLDVRALRPGRRARVVRSVRNQTGRTVVVAVRGLADTRDLDRVLRVRVAVDGKPVADAPLGALRRWSERWFQLRRGQTRLLELEAWVPADAGAAARGHVAEVRFELRTRPRLG